MADKETTSNLRATISNLVEGATKPELGVLVERILKYYLQQNLER
jgi:hypothetical protein